MPSQVEVPFQLDAAHRRVLVGGEPMIFHCHHYNSFLQRTILDADAIDSTPALVGAAAEVAHQQLSALFAERKLQDVASRQALAQEVYRWAGFGTLGLEALGPEGGAVSTRNSHYALAWKVKFKQAKAPVCFFASGWLAGALAAIHGRPNGAYQVHHPRCSAVEGAECVFEVRPGQANYGLFQSPGAGPLSAHQVRPVPANNVDYEGIFGALSGMPIVGNADGVIPAFGVYLTRHYANYYNRISFEFERALTQRFGEEGRQVAAPLLIEAGHVCAFHTFGGIMTSTEWDALIRPNLRTREDWVHGMIAATNALGWGRWQVTQVSEAGAEFVLHDDYESVGHLAMYGKSDHPVSYLAQGGVAGLMNLVYLGNISARPELTSDYYDQLFKRAGAYVAQPLSSRAMGDEVTSFRVTRG